MDNNKLTYSIEIHAEEGVATIRGLKGQLVATKIPLEELRKEFGNFAKTVNASRFDTFNKELKNAAKSNQVLAGASGGATSAVLELGRVVQDAPYGIRGMANNITQLASQMAFATKSAGSFKGALKDMGKAMIGPLGIVFAISIVVSLLDGFFGGMKKSTEGVNEFNDSLELLKIKMDLIAEDMPSLADDIDKILGVLKDDDTKTLEDILFSASLKDNIKILKAEFRDFAKYYDNLKDSQKDDKSFMEGTIRKYQELLSVRKSVSEQEKRILDLTKKERENPKLIIAWEKIRSDYKKALLAKIDLENFFNKKNQKGERERANALGSLDPIDPREEAKKAREKLEMVAKALGVDLKMNPLGIPLELDLELTEETDEKLQKIFDDKINGLKEYADMAKSILSTISSFIDAEFERELTLEQNKTNSLNNELNQRLLNENLSKSERANIQNEIAKNDEALRKKQEIIEKKRFNTNKAFAIASALIDTAGSAVKAYGSQLVVGEPSSLLRAQIAAGAATALGLAQVAMIARQQFQSSAGSATPIRGLGSSGGEGDRSFNYNLVGNNQANQIAEALQGQFSNPLKAYVVSREVTTQQELDMNIKSGASF